MVGNIYDDCIEKSFLVFFLKIRLILKAKVVTQKSYLKNHLQNNTEL